MSHISWHYLGLKNLEFGRMLLSAFDEYIILFDFT